MAFGPIKRKRLFKKIIIFFVGGSFKNELTENFNYITKKKLNLFYIYLIKKLTKVFYLRRY
jgi:hypothetical protein